jgi:acid phosphatase family membrane protein YuiD
VALSAAFVKAGANSEQRIALGGRCRYNPPMVSKLPIGLLTAVAVQVACQAFKVVYYSLREKRLALSWFASAGGMPSAHSAFVTALTVSVGLWEGFGSSVFAVACVFSVITIYDALRLRGAVEHHARILSMLMVKHPDVPAGIINTRLGHTLPQIFAGVCTGGGLSVLAWWALRQSQAL